MKKFLFAALLFVVTNAAKAQCSGTPDLSDFASSAWSGCTSSSISLFGFPYYWDDSGHTYQWQSSPDTVTWSNIAGATSYNATAPGITAVTYYRVVVTCPASGLSAYGQITKVESKATCACTPLYTGPFGEGLLSDLAIYGYDSSHILDNVAGCYGITEYANKTDSFSLVFQQGGTYNVQLHYDYTDTGVENAVWIDFNDDNIFSSSENVSGVFGSPHIYVDTATGEINIPASAHVGTHLMRIRNAEVYLEPGIEMSPCDSAYDFMYFHHYLSGLTLDYKVNILPGLLPASHSFTLAIDTLCNGAGFNIVANDSTGDVLSMKTYYGDGTSDSLTGTTVAYFSFIDFSHAYSSPGTYTIKHVLYDAGLPVDSISYSYYYTPCNTIKLNFYYDANSDCIYDVGDLLFTTPISIEIDSNGVTIDTLSTTTGYYYNAHGTVGDVYQFKPLPTVGGVFASCPASGIITDTIGASSICQSDTFALFCGSASGFDLWESSFVLARPHYCFIDIGAGNSYCSAEDATLTVTFSPKYAFYSAAPSSYTTLADSVSWSLSGLTLYGLPSGSHYISLHPAGLMLTLGDTVQTTIAITPIAGDADTTNNVTIRIDTVTGSYDPNEMSVNPSGHILSGTQLQYTIGFENTGNDTAHNIYVMDTLSPNVNIKSLQLVAASAAMYTSVITDSAGNHILKFDFPGINLLDSSHHGLCDGMVVFNIKAKDGLPDGTTIFNHAGIFFDDNPVVLTDTVEDIIGIPSTSASHIAPPSVKVYPNPAQDMIMIDGAMPGSSVTIYNLLGEQVYTGAVSNQKQSVPMNGLAAGSYIVRVRTAAGYIINTRVVKAD